MMFDASKHIIKLQGRDYLEVKWRIVWFRDECPGGTIKTELVHYEDGLAIVRASVIVDGNLISTGLANADSRGKKTLWSGKEIMKAETAAIGRALALAGYGTQFTVEDEGDFLADAPIESTPSSVIKDTSKNPKPTAAGSNQKSLPTKQWSDKEIASFNDNVSRRFPGSLAVQVGIKEKLNIANWYELGTQVEALSFLYPMLYEKCVPVKVERMRYVINGEKKYLEFSVDENSEIHQPVRAYGRSTTIKNEWLGDYAYTIGLGWNNFDKDTKTTEWAPIDADIIMHYKCNEHGTLIATGIGHNIEDPQLVEDANEQF